MEEIIKYIKREYSPVSIIIYGSYADDSKNDYSDFDALVISESHEIFHDMSLVGGVQLDVFIYPKSYFDSNFDVEDFVQLFHSKIIMDTNSIGMKLKGRVIDFVDHLGEKTPSEIYSNVKWCEKMLSRTKRNDVEGMFRWHFVLTESLKIFCEVKAETYFGPKKSLKWMEEKYPEAFDLYKEALFNYNTESLENWINYIVVNS